ncbi:MAG: helix-turn-helix domain-containing protein [Pyrinomonadaceae bacterium]
MVQVPSVEEMLTTSEAAKKLGISPGRVRQLVVDGRLPVVRMGRDNFIRAADLALVQKRKTGRPPKPPTSTIANASSKRNSRRRRKS